MENTPPYKFYLSLDRATSLNPFVTQIYAPSTFNVLIFEFTAVPLYTNILHEYDEMVKYANDTPSPQLIDTPDE